MDHGRTELATNVALTTGANRYRLQMGSATALGIQVDWTVAGSGVAAMTIWYSNKKDPSITADTDWVQDSTLTFTTLNGSATQAFYTLEPIAATYLMIKIAYTSGTSVTYSLVTQRKGG